MANYTKREESRAAMAVLLEQEYYSSRTRLTGLLLNDRLANPSDTARGPKLRLVDRARENPARDGVPRKDAPVLFPAELTQIGLTVAWLLAQSCAGWGAKGTRLWKVQKNIGNAPQTPTSSPKTPLINRVSRSAAHYLISWVSASPALSRRSWRA